MSYMYLSICMSQCLTLQRISGQAELADNVAGDVRLHQVPLFGVILGCLQQVVKVLRVKLLHQKGDMFNLDTLPVFSALRRVSHVKLNINIMILQQRPLVLKGVLLFCKKKKNAQCRLLTPCVFDALVIAAVAAAYTLKLLLDFLLTLDAFI